MVGAVVLDASGSLAGEGFHREQGQPHAEQEALAAAGPSASGGTIYVNLEPCTHSHRKPPCAQAIIAAGVKRAVISMQDPDPRVNGAGIQQLRAAGVEVVFGILEEPAARLNEFYVKHRRTGRPFVSAKFAMSLDGKIATASGESRWITGEAARRHGHQLRHRHDAILVGLNTILKDDPELSARLPAAETRQPLRIVLDSRLRTPATARVLSSRTLIATVSDQQLPGAETVRLPATRDGRVALEPLLDELGRRGIVSLLVEGGGETLASFFAGGLVDKVYAYIAPLLIGGREAPTALGGTGAQRLADAHHLSGTEVTQLEEDLLVSGYLDVHRGS